MCIRHSHNSIFTVRSKIELAIAYYITAILSVHLFFLRLFLLTLQLLTKSDSILIWIPRQNPSLHLFQFPSNQ